MSNLQLLTVNDSKKYLLNGMSIIEEEYKFCKLNKDQIQIDFCMNNDESKLVYLDYISTIFLDNILSELTNIYKTMFGYKTLITPYLLKKIKITSPVNSVLFWEVNPDLNENNYNFCKLFTPFSKDAYDYHEDKHKYICKPIQANIMDMHISLFTVKDNYDEMMSYYKSYSNDKYLDKITHYKEKYNEFKKKFYHLVSEVKK